MKSKGVPKLFKGFTNTSFLLILLGTVLWSLTMIRSGLVYLSGMGFWGPHGHDGVWHIALAKSLARGTWGMPIFAGEEIKNYHIGFDLLLSIIYKITGIPIHNLYFQIIPVIMAFAIGFLVYRFVYVWTKSKQAALWSTFFVYFGGSLGWIVTLLRGQGLGGESMFWSQQSISTLVNPPFALSLAVIFLGLNLLFSYKKKQKKRYLFIASLAFGLLVQIKIYASILILGGLFVAGVYNLIRRKGFDIIKVFTGALIVSILLIPVGASNTGLIIFRPFWFLETMMLFVDRLNWPNFYWALQTYKEQNNYLKGLLAFGVAFAIFWYGNVGTRMINEGGIFTGIKNKKRPSWIQIFIAFVVIAGVVLPMLFLQKGTPWNTIQFFYYSLMFLGVLAGISTARWTRNSSKRKAGVITFFIVALTIPTTIGTLKNVYLPKLPPAVLPIDEMEALEFLSSQPEGVVLTYPFDREKAEATSGMNTRPLSLYESTSYVSAFSDKPVYLEDEVNLEIMDYNWRQRKEKVQRFFATNDSQEAIRFIKDNDIQYVYLLKDQQVVLDQDYLNIVKIFENQSTAIYKLSL